jgi:glycosyltransferase involved in cell wall biosynthesis
MKIGVDIRVLMDRYYSGIAHYSANLLSELIKSSDDHQYRLFYNSFKKIDGKMSKWQGERTKLVATKYPNKLFNYIGQKLLKRPRIDKLLGEIEVFWSPHFNFTSLSPKTKHVVTIHDLSFMRYPEFFNQRKNFWHKAINLKQQLKKCQAIIAVSNNTKADIIELLKVPEEKVFVIYSGLNKYSHKISQGEENDFLEKHQLKNNFILYLGNIEPRKNISGLIHAYNILRDRNIRLVDTQLVLAGATGWKNREIYLAKENSAYKENIKFIGHVNLKEREILFKRASFLVYPSFYEGFGFPPLEAMEANLPVITSNVSSLPEVVGKAALTINPYNINDLARSMELLIYDNNLRNHLIQEGKIQANKFKWSKTADQYLKIFKQIIS